MLGEVVDCIAILAIVILNAVIGFYQEFNAEKSIAALKKMTAPRASVRRNGQLNSIPASEIVTGDILELESGDLVAADARLLGAASLNAVAFAGRLHGPHGTRKSGHCLVCTFTPVFGARARRTAAKAAALPIHLGCIVPA